MSTFIKQAMQIAAKTLSASERTQLRRLMSNWVKVSDILYKKDITEDTVLAMLSFELENQQRPYVISRIYSRYSTLRLRREQRELGVWLKNLKKPQKSTWQKELAQLEENATNGQEQ